MSMLTLEQPIFDGRGCPTGTTLWKSTPQADLHGTNPKDQRSPRSRRGNAGFKEEWPRAVGCLRGNNTMRERERERERERGGGRWWEAWRWKDTHCYTHYYCTGF
jgi:hypothetical protein